MEHALIVGKYTLESLTNGMYASPLDMYREYIQNAVDSFDMALNRKAVSIDKLRIDIDIDAEKKLVSIKDNGCGISESNAAAMLLDIGNSQKSRSDFRGFRGIGRLAGLGYCDKLIFKTSYENEAVSTIVEFDARFLNELLIPGNSDGISINDVMERIVQIKKISESPSKSYFEVILEGVALEEGLTEGNAVKDYLIQHAPLSFDPRFKWQKTILEKVRLAGYRIPQYHLFLNGEEVFKPYLDTFVSDRVKRAEEQIQDIRVEKFERNGKLCAVLWYAQSNFYGTIIDNIIKGIRIRQGNILLGDKSSFNQFFKEERFNGWMIGELHVVDKELIANSRRDGFEKNAAFYELAKLLKEWTFRASKEIRHVSYERSLSSERKAIVEAERVDDVNDLCTEQQELEYAFTAYNHAELCESDEVAETDFISKLSMFISQKKAQTKYTVLNINDKLTVEQRKVLERVFDIINQNYDQKISEEFVNTIVSWF